MKEVGIIRIPKFRLVNTFLVFILMTTILWCWGSQLQAAPDEALQSAAIQTPSNNSDSTIKPDKPNPSVVKPATSSPTALPPTTNPQVQVIKAIYGYSGEGRPLTCVTLKPANSQGKATFLNFAIHGAEDAWIGDSWMLVQVADEVEKYFTANPEMLNGTTLTIVRLANPDGLFDGWTNNGPGRCTVVGGYDLNRIWPTGFMVSRGVRNNTGNVSMLAPEADALRDLVLLKASENGGRLNNVYDFHGWGNTSYGSSSICWQFQVVFGIKYSGSLGGGYFARWAQGYANNTALIELPWPTEWQQANYSKNTIAALKMVI
jgi:hypothetical protein